MDGKTLSIQAARVAAFLTYQQHAVAHFALIDSDGEKRTSSAFQQRLNWDEFVQKHKDRPLFRRHLRMTYDSFLRLLEMIKPHLVMRDERMASLRGGQILPELHLYATIRFLAGGLYSDICLFCGISIASFYSVLWRTVHAINKAIKINFPRTTEECAVHAAQFEGISHRGVISNCVGVLDGYLVAIVTPPKKLAKNVRSYFSGHYQKYGINVQACADAHCRFTFVGIGGPGVVKDRQAVKESGLYDKIHRLPPGYITIGDAAYQPTESLVPIFGDALALPKDHDNFNFFASQLRIRVEMAFGIMTRKWGILQRPLSVSLPSIKHVICCIARLHNFCIDERLRVDNSIILTTTNSLSFSQLAYMNASAEVREESLSTFSIGIDYFTNAFYFVLSKQAEHQEIMSDEYPQWSLARDELVKKVKAMRLVRPTANDLRKRQRELPRAVQEYPAFQDVGQEQ